MIGVHTLALMGLLSVAPPAGVPAPNQPAGNPGSTPSDSPAPDANAAKPSPDQPLAAPDDPDPPPPVNAAKPPPGQPLAQPDAPPPPLAKPTPGPGANAAKPTPGQPLAQPGANKPLPPATGTDPSPTAPPTPGALPADPGPPPEPDAGTNGPITLVAEVSPEPSNIGDLLTLTVTAAYPAGYSVNLPTGINFGSLHRVAVEESEPESTGTGFRKQFKISLQAFAVGEGRVPAFPLTYLDDKGEVHTVNAPATTFTVESLLANENEPKREVEDPPISLEYPNDRLELVIYSALAALLLGFIGMMLWGRWRRRTKPVYRPPPTPAHEVALSALEELEQRSLVEDGKFQLYYLELTEITKGYIEGRFGIEALDRTTEEIRRELLREAKRIEPLEAKDVVDFLQACDLVKFARFAPPIDEASGALGAVRTMVEQSLPSLTPEQDASTPESEPSADAGEQPAPVTANASTPNKPVTAPVTPTATASTGNKPVTANASSPKPAPATPTDGAQPKPEPAAKSPEGDSP